MSEDHSGAVRQKAYAIKLQRIPPVTADSYVSMTSGTNEHYAFVLEYKTKVFCL